jgi:hypothetical protein
MSVNEKMTAIANAIRNKTGKTNKLTLDQMPLEIDSIGSVGIQSASGTYTLATDAVGITIDVSNVGFIPDLAIVYLDDSEMNYTTQPTKMWILQLQPDLLDFIGLAEPSNTEFTTTNIVVIFRGSKGTYTQATASNNSNYIGKPINSDEIVVKVGRPNSTYPVIAGTYKWFVYKVWG